MRMFVFHKDTISRIIKQLDNMEDTIRIGKIFSEIEDNGEDFAITPLICSQCGCAEIAVHLFPTPFPGQCPKYGAITYKIDDEKLTLMERKFGKFGGII